MKHAAALVLAVLLGGMAYGQTPESAKKNPHHNIFA